LKLACNLLIFGFGLVSASRFEADISSHSQASHVTAKGKCEDIVKGSVESTVEEEGTVRAFFDWVTPEDKKKVGQLCVCADLTQEVYTVTGAVARRLGALAGFGYSPGLTLGPAIFTYEAAVEASTNKYARNHECMTHPESVVRGFDAGIKEAQEVDSDKEGNKAVNAFLKLIGYGHAIKKAAEALEIPTLGKDTAEYPKLRTAWLGANDAKENARSSYRTELRRAKGGLQYATTFLESVGTRYAAELQEGTSLVVDIVAEMKQASEVDKLWPPTFFVGEPQKKVERLVEIAASLVEKLKPELTAYAQSFQ